MVKSGEFWFYVVSVWLRLMLLSQRFVIEVMNDSINRMKKNSLKE